MSRLLNKHPVTMYRGPNNLNNLNEDLDEELPSRSECEDIHIVKSKPNVYFEAE